MVSVHHSGWAAKAGAALVVLLVALGGGCSRGAHSAASTHLEKVLGPEHLFPINVGGHSVKLRLAVHESERQHGLMNVTTMPADEGMLFVWAKPQAMSFYMRNTRLPLDIGYFDGNGVLREIYPMYPGVEDSVQSHRQDLQLALEMNQGWYLRHEVKPDATIDLTGVRAALHARGYDPEKYFPEK